MCQQTGLAVQHPDGRGAIQLVPGKDIKIGIQGLDVNSAVDHGLAAVQQHGDAAVMGQADDLRGWHNGAQDVGAMGDCH